MAAPKRRTESAIKMSQPIVFAMIVPMEVLCVGDFAVEGAALGLLVGESVECLVGATEGGLVALVGADVGVSVTLVVGATVG
jgi:hypothetical protein